MDIMGARGAQVRNRRIARAAVLRQSLSIKRFDVNSPLHSVVQGTTDDRDDRSDLSSERPLGERPCCCDGDLLRHGSLDRELGTEPY